jgi:hypothetical protein
MNSNLMNQMNLGDSSQGDYPITAFDSQVILFGLSKAYQLSIKTLLDLCRSLHAWLGLSEDHVV